MKKFGVVRVFFLLVVVLVLSVVPTIEVFLNQEERNNGFEILEPSEFLGIIWVWNVDTFEGGESSKMSVLQKAASMFEKQNKGVMFFIENLSVDEFLNRKENEMPDVLCFGTGVYADTCDALTETASCDFVYDNVFECSVVLDRSVAVPWCLGSYYLISTGEALVKSGKEQVELASDFYQLGYVKKIGKKNKEVASVVLGQDAFHNKFDALSAFEIVEGSQVLVKNTGYEAYSCFREGNAVVLFGTQRDLSRMENKLSQGDVSELFVVQCPKTDMVQFASVTKNCEESKIEYAKKFCQFLQSEAVQIKVDGAGLLTVVDICKTNKNLDRKGTAGSLEIKKIF